MCTRYRIFRCCFCACPTAGNVTMHPLPRQVYVTHKLREHGPAVWALLAAGCVVFVAGSANKMPAGVESALTVRLQLVSFFDTAAGVMLL